MAKLPFVINDGKWHHICVTWTTRDGVWEAYQDGTQGGNGENLAPYHPIKPQGVLVLGQEQVLVWAEDEGGMCVCPWVCSGNKFSKLHGSGPRSQHPWETAAGLSLAWEAQFHF